MADDEDGDEDGDNDDEAQGRRVHTPLEQLSSSHPLDKGRPHSER